MLKNFKENADAWRKYIPGKPSSYDCLGDIQKDSVRGALMRDSAGRTNRYFFLSRDEFSSLDGNEVIQLIGSKGRKPTGVRKLNVTLDDATIEAASKAGKGNISAGLRKLASKK